MNQNVITRFLTALNDDKGNSLILSLTRHGLDAFHVVTENCPIESDTLIFLIDVNKFAPEE